MDRKPYPAGVSDEKWAFAASYVTLMTEEAQQRKHELRELFNSLRYVMRRVGVWRMTPHDLPPAGITADRPRQEGPTKGGHPERPDDYAGVFVGTDGDAG